MKHGETIAHTLGYGAMTIRECSDNPNVKIPALCLMRPAIRDVVYAGVNAVPSTDPASSFDIAGEQVKELYDFLKAYYAAPAEGKAG